MISVQVTRTAKIWNRVAVRLRQFAEDAHDPLRVNVNGMADKIEMAVIIVCGRWESDAFVTLTFSDDDLFPLFGISKFKGGLGADLTDG